MQRKQCILRAACDQFGRFGYRGASLRDIARDAGVSLPLLNHHFGDKAALLVAVVATQRHRLAVRVESLRHLAAAPVAVSPAELVHAWLQPGFDMAATLEGDMFLRLQLRVFDEPAEEGLPIVVGELEDAALLFIEALQRCYPSADRYALSTAQVFVSAATLKFLNAAQRKFRFAQAAMPEVAALEDAARLERFLVAGIEVSLGPRAAADRQRDNASSRAGACAVPLVIAA